jgi:hypothetical protein
VADIIPKLSIDPDKHRAQMEDIARSLLEEAKAEVRYTKGEGLLLRPSRHHVDPFKR